MENINKISKLSIWIFIVPLISLNACLILITNFHQFFNLEDVILPTIPYIDGGVSISRTARTYPTYLLFKPGMIITAVLLIQYWIANNRLFRIIGNGTTKNRYFLFFGVGSALFLALHSIFLGINFEMDSFLLGQIEKFLRRFIPVSYTHLTLPTICSV